MALVKWIDCGFNTIFGIILMALKNILRKLGLSIQRVPTLSELSSDRENNTKGTVVEFVGPAAVGKSTVFNATRSVLKKNWLFEHHTRLPEDASPIDANTGSFLGAIYQARLDLLRRLDLDIYAKTKIIKRMSEIVQMELNVARQNYPRGFVFEEGISHFFAEQILDTEAIKDKKIFANRHFVFLLPDDPDTLKMRRDIRQSSGNDKMHRHQSGTGDSQPDAAADQAQKEISIYTSLEQLFRTNGFSTLVLVAEDTVEHNADRTLAFVRNGY